MKGFMIAGVSSGIGKTTVSMGLMSLFENVSPFKVGPDYIDTTFHQFVTGNKSYNLDLFMMGEEGVKYSFYKHHKGISIVEGVMGLYDGMDHGLDNNSSAHLSRVLDLPVILIVSGGGKSTSIAAEVLGYKMLDNRVKIAGIIINKTTEAMYKHYKEAIEKYTEIECVGYIPKDENFEIGSRHLGLLQAGEIDNLKFKVEKLKEVLMKTINIKKLLEIAELGEREKVDNPFENIKNRYSGVKIGVAKDRAFSFYYNDNLELMEELGIELIPFSPIVDKKIPEVDLLYFGGGYPENYAKELSDNIEMMNSIKEYYNKNGKIYGECGGFMYLSSGIKLLDDKYFPMCDIIKCSIEMKDRLDISRFGYISLHEDESFVGRGHEFHYSKIYDIEKDSRKYKAVKFNGKEWSCVFKEKNCRAGYPHIHFFKSLDYLDKIINGQIKE